MSLCATQGKPPAVIRLTFLRVLNTSPAAICYLLLIISVNYFILHDTKRGYLDAFILGFVIYGVFDSTNQAIIKKWNPYLSIIDTIWGGILMTLTTFITLKVFPR